ncbi:hypothetical protein GRF61_11305 [Azoarcus sp. TTM-91]|uniref:restriction endonuclease subunit S n=1 Tax=Azoarcus sp. TTM-91 TaxID=2691581 RepID=UPI00145D06BB|nr:restriction endonuclease subunit S [Azoarcus sp. TTM-91]NMG35028.1 hypothetical protein [Azoarcus sp. TTM-91]
MSEFDRLPEGWSIQPLHTFIAELESGVSVNADDREKVGSEIGVLKTSCVSNGKFAANEHKAIWPKDVMRAKVSPREGEIIISRMNTPILVGESGLVPKTDNALFLPDRLWQTVARKETRTDFKWLNQVLQWEPIRKKIRDAATGTSNSMKNISKAEFLAIEVPTPPWQDQCSIAEVLSTLDEQIEATDATVHKLNMQRKGLAADLLTCRHLPTSEIADVRLAEVMPTVQYGISSSLTEAGAIPVLRMNNLSGGEIDVSDLKYSPTDVPSDLYLKPGDVLFNRTNSMEHVGRTSLWRGQLTKCTFASYLVRLSPDSKRLLPEYLVYLLEWEENQLQMRKYATPGVQQVNINPTSLRRCRVRIPKSLDAQRETVAALDAARENMEALREEVAKLKLQKQGLMRDLLTGAVRVTGDH